MLKVEIPISWKFKGNYYDNTSYTCQGCNSNRPSKLGVVTVEINGNKWHSDCYKKWIDLEISQTTRKISHLSQEYSYDWIDETFDEIDKLVDYFKHLHKKNKQFMLHKEYRIVTGYYSNDKYIKGARHIRVMRFGRFGSLNFTKHLDFNVEGGKAELLARILTNAKEFDDKELLRKALDHAEEWKKLEVNK